LTCGIQGLQNYRIFGTLPSINPDTLKKWQTELENTMEAQRDDTWFKISFAHYSIAFLGTDNRLNMTRQIESNQKNSLQKAPVLLQALYENDPRIEELISSIVKDTFNMDIKLDYSHLCELFLRVSNDFGEIPEDPRIARPILEKFEKLDDQGDGIRSFVATVLVMLASKQHVLLIDEPEAFLHPPQARKLGEQIARYSKDRQIFIATHSSDLLSGILTQRQEDVTIIRIERFGDENEINLLDDANLMEIISHPLLSSARILEAIFYNGTVIVEGDSDSTFYQRISRIIRNSDDIHYVHAHSKQAIPIVANSYAKLGIRFAIIVDFDVLRIQDEFRGLLKRLNIDKETITELLELREVIEKEINLTDKSELLRQIVVQLDNIKKKILEPDDSVALEGVLSGVQRDLDKVISSPWHKYKNSGSSILTPTTQVAFLKLDSICKRYGIFIVPVGELESWLIDYGIPRSSKKSKWITKALTELPNIQIDEKTSVGKFTLDIHNYLLKGG
jgi:hypothetical protein